MRLSQKKISFASRYFVLHNFEALHFLFILYSEPFPFLPKERKSANREKSTYIKKAI